MKHFILFIALICNTLYLIAQNNISDTNLVDNSIWISDVIVSGNIKKDPHQLLLAQNYRVKVVQPKNSGELFNELNGFSLIKRGNYAVDPSFRASQYEQLNIQFDGGTKATHACPNRMDPITSFMNPEEVVTIEVIKGPFSVRYGNTFGGIVNMVSGMPDLKGKAFSGNLATGYESNGNSLMGMINLFTKVGNADVYGNVSYRNYGNYKDGDNTEIPSAFKSLSYDFKVGYNFTKKQRLQLGFKQNFGRDVLHAGLAMDTEIDDSSIGSIDYKLESSHHVFKGFVFHAYYSKIEHVMNNYSRPSFDAAEAISSLEAQVFGGKWETEFDFGTKLKLFAGVDMVNLSRQGERNRLVKINMMGMPLAVPLEFVDKVWQDSYTNNLGTFAEMKWFINESTMANFGIRIDHIQSDANDLDAGFKLLYPNLKPTFENVFGGTISLRHQINSNYNLEFSLGRGARPANIEERYISNFTIGQDMYEYIGNPYLKAEVNNQAELSLHGKNPLSGNFQLLRYGASVYYSYYQNYIMAIEDTTLIKKYSPSTPPIHPKVFRNIDKAYKTGAEVFAELHFAKYFKLGAEMAYVYTNNIDFDESLPLTPPLTSKFMVGFENDNYWMSVHYTSVAPQNNISVSFSEASSAGYELFDLKMGAKFWNRLNLGVGLLNAFNVKYHSHLNYSFNNQDGFTRIPVTEIGRNFTLFLNFNF